MRRAKEIRRGDSIVIISPRYPPVHRKEEKREGSCDDKLLEVRQQKRDIVTLANLELFVYGMVVPTHNIMIVCSKENTT